jgi:hypothetical protein
MTSTATGNAEALRCPDLRWICGQAGSVPGVSSVHVTWLILNLPCDVRHTSCPAKPSLRSLFFLALRLARHFALPLQLSLPQTASAALVPGTCARFDVFPLSSADVPCSPPRPRHDGLAARLEVSIARRARHPTRHHHRLPQLRRARSLPPPPPPAPTRSPSRSSSPYMRTRCCVC